ncbi:MAG: hypothetical protein ABEI97_02785, partial [Candidatus Nanohaloarchaea archaeon]
GALLVALDYVGLGPTVTLNRFMLFMVLGTALFIGYSLLFTIIRTTSSLVGVLEKLGSLLAAPFRSDDASDTSRTKEKEIVLDELADD